MKVLHRNGGREIADTNIQLTRRRKRFPWIKMILVISLLAYLGYGGYCGYRYIKSLPPKPVAMVDGSADDLKELQVKYFGLLIYIAKFVAVDGVLARNKSDDAVVFAKSANLPIDTVVAFQKTLPLAKKLPDGCQIQPITVYREGTVTTVEISVLDGGLKPIHDLTRVDFNVIANGLRLHRVGVVEYVKSQKRPSIAVLVDRSGSTQGTPFIRSQEALISFVNAVCGTAQVRLFAFASDAKPITPWTSNSTELVTAIKSLQAEGGTALNRAVRLAVDDLESGDSSKSIVIFTDGKDSFNDKTIEATIQKAKASKITIHVVALLNTGENDEPAMKGMTAATGGSYRPVERPEGLAAEFVSLAKSLNKPFYRLLILDPISAPAKLEILISNLSPLSLNLN